MAAVIVEIDFIVEAAEEETVALAEELEAEQLAEEAQQLRQWVQEERMQASVRAASQGEARNQLSPAQYLGKTSQDISDMGEGPQYEEIQARWASRIAERTGFEPDTTYEPEPGAEDGGAQDANADENPTDAQVRDRFTNDDTEEQRVGKGQRMVEREKADIAKKPLWKRALIYGVQIVFQAALAIAAVVLGKYVLGGLCALGKWVTGGDNDCKACNGSNTLGCKYKCCTAGCKTAAAVRKWITEHQELLYLTVAGIAAGIVLFGKKLVAGAVFFGVGWAAIWTISSVFGYLVASAGCDVSILAKMF